MLKLNAFLTEKNVKFSLNNKQVLNNSLFSIEIFISLLICTIEVGSKLD